MQYKKPDGKCAALNEMLHVLLRYLEVNTDLRFVSIFKLILELGVASIIHLDEEINDDVFF